MEWLLFNLDYSHRDTLYMERQNESEKWKQSEMWWNRSPIPKKAKGWGIISKWSAFERKKYPALEKQHKFTYFKK